MHGAWCWEAVTPVLVALGHEVRAIDLPGAGDDPTPPEAVTNEDWIACVAAAARDGGGKALLVGHSLGGTAIAQGAERAAEHVLGTVFLTAILLNAGESVAADLADLGAHVESARERHGDDQAAMMTELLYATSPPDKAESALARLRPQPQAIFTAPMQLSVDRFGRLPRAYIECSEDGVLPLAMQRRMQANWPCDPVLTMTGDHSPFLGQPEALAAHIDAIARRFAG